MKEHKSLNELKALSHKNDFPFQIGRLNFKTPLKDFLDLLKVNFESMIFHKNLFDQETQKDCSIFLFKEKLIKSEVITNSTVIEKEKLNILLLEIKRLIDIELEASGNYFFVKLCYINDVSIDTLAKISLKFDNYKEAQIFKYFIEKEKISAWQHFFEKAIITEQFIYQYHFFLKKVNSRGDEEKRLIVLTDEFILNIDYQIVLLPKKNDFGGKEFDFKLHKPKWALSIKSFEELQLIKKKKTNDYMIKIKVNQKENKTYVNEHKLPFKNKTSTDFIFRNEKMCRFFIFQIKRLYYNLNEKRYIKVTESLG